MPHYKLTYFNVTGRVEPARVMFHYGEIPFEDVRIEHADWPSLKPKTPFGELPVLEIDGKKYTQGVSLARYVANIVGLVGKTNEENLEIEIAVNIVSELLITAYEFHYEPNEEKKKQNLKKLNELMDKYLPVLDEAARKNEGHLVTNRLTWADIFFVTSYEDIRHVLKNKDIVKDFSGLQNLKKNVLAEKNIKQYIQNRPKIPTYAYDLRSEL
ncbi:glutathione S-transferase-like [Diabrotica undecimpunctata]|uniref:glutathione S-transferase-like n=1 Tax=Diabrotica undecimpunctata TaxID=50387 RepID=UPI003B6403F9